MLGVKKNQDDVETYTNSNLEERKRVDGSCEQDILCGNEISC